MSDDAALIAAAGRAAHALWECERKLRHLAPHYKGRSAQEICAAANLANAASNELSKALKSQGNK